MKYRVVNTASGEYFIRGPACAGGLATHTASAAALFLSRDAAQRWINHRRMIQVHRGAWVRDYHIEEVP